MVGAREALSEVVFFILVVPMGWPFAAYALLQCLNVVVLRGGLRWASIVPLPFAVAVFVLTAVAYADGSNLWPILLIFFGLAALAYETLIIGIFLVQSYRSYRSRDVSRESDDG
jgi:hypothetical protein